MSANDGNVKSGDRANTSVNEARPDEIGTGPARATVDPTSFGGTTSIRHSERDNFDVNSDRADYDGVEIMEPTDGRLGLTNTNNIPADD